MIAALEEAWRSGDERMTQVDWTGLYDANLFSSEGAALYLADRRMERVEGWQAAFSATAPERDGFRCDYGFRLRRDRSNFYREAADCSVRFSPITATPLPGWKATCGIGTKGGPRRPVRLRLRHPPP